MVSYSIQSLQRLCSKLYRLMGRRLVVVHDDFSHCYRVYDIGSYPFRVIGCFKNLFQVHQFLMDLFRYPVF